MYEAPTAAVAETASPPRRTRLLMRVLLACLISFVLPALLAFLGAQGLGSRAGLWALALMPLPALCTWAFLGRRKPSGVGRSIAVLVGIIFAVLLCFVFGSVVITMAALLWQPEVKVVLPQPGA